MANANTRPKVLITAPDIDAGATGESLNGYRLALAMSEQVDLTVFAFQRHNRESLQDLLPNAKVHTIKRPKIFNSVPRFEAMVKPLYFYYYIKLRKFIRANKDNFDLAHQILPAAPRYPIALQGLGVPYVVGPLSGALDTPHEMKREFRKKRLEAAVREIDRFRFKWDHQLRKSYLDAEEVLIVAEYMEEQLSDIPIKKLTTFLHLSIGNMPNLVRRNYETQNIRLLHVGRGVRSKGLRDTIRAFEKTRSSIAGLRLTVAGEGPEIEYCKELASKLGVQDEIRFTGHLSSVELEEEYKVADILVFPSFREPAGNVILEAMSWGLPVITTDRGGPGTLVDHETGIRVPVATPIEFAKSISDAIKELATDPIRRRKMSEAARNKAAEIGLWTNKSKRLIEIYDRAMQREKTWNKD